MDYDTIEGADGGDANADQGDGEFDGGPNYQVHGVLWNTHEKVRELSTVLQTGK